MLGSNMRIRESHLVNIVFPLFQLWFLLSEEMPELKPSLPFGQVPVLEYRGTTLCQSMAIARWASLSLSCGWFKWDMLKSLPITWLITHHNLLKIAILCNVLVLCNVGGLGPCLTELCYKLQRSLKHRIVFLHSQVPGSWVWPGRAEQAGWCQDWRGRGRCLWLPKCPGIVGNLFLISIITIFSSTKLTLRKMRHWRRRKWRKLRKRLCLKAWWVWLNQIKLAVDHFDHPASVSYLQANLEKLLEKRGGQYFVGNRWTSVQISLSFYNAAMEDGPGLSFTSTRS